MSETQIENPKVEAGLEMALKMVWNLEGAEARFDELLKMAVPIVQDQGLNQQEDFRGKIACSELMTLVVEVEFQLVVEE